MSDKEVVTLFVEPPVAELTLNREGKRNALSEALLRAFESRIVSIGKRFPEVSVLIVRGAGPSFSAGADIGELDQRSPGTLGAYIELGHHVFQLLKDSPFVAIAGLQGHVLGGGLELALACDIRIAASNAKLGFPEINLGGIPGWGGTIRLPELIGRGRATEMVLTGRVIDALTAHSFGLVNEVVPEDALQAACSRLALTLASKSPAALRLAKRALDVASPYGTDTQLAVEESANLALMGEATRVASLKGFATTADQVTT